MPDTRYTTRLGRAVEGGGLQTRLRKHTPVQIREPCPDSVSPACSSTDRTAGFYPVRHRRPRCRFESCHAVHPHHQYERSASCARTPAFPPARRATPSCWRSCVSHARATAGMSMPGAYVIRTARISISACGNTVSGEPPIHSSMLSPVEQRTVTAPVPGSIPGREPVSSPLWNSGAASDRDPQGHQFEPRKAPRAGIAQQVKASGC